MTSVVSLGVLEDVTYPAYSYHARDTRLKDFLQGCLLFAW